jgi:uncharacterized protein involved in exopolysaccharide biosynthesis
MDVGDFFRLMLRRWAVTVPGLILTALATAAAYMAVPTQYQSQVQMTLLNAPKVTSEQGNFGNPYLAFDTALLADADLLARNLSSNSAAQQLQSLGMTEDYTAALADNALGPFLQLTVTGPGRPDVQRSMQTLIRFSQQRWLSLQQASSAPQGSIIQMTLIAAPSVPTPVNKRKFEAVAGVAIAGIVLTILLAVLVDSIIRRRRSERGMRHLQHEPPARPVPTR